MAVQEQLEILTSGAYGLKWNYWREEHPEIIPDLSGADLSYASLCNTFFNSILGFSVAEIGTDTFRGINLNHANLRDATLFCATLLNVDLIKANLCEADLSFSTLIDADLSYANLMNADLYDANLSGANLSYANLSGADLTRTNLRRTNLRGANLSRVTFHQTIFAETNLSKLIGLETARYDGPSNVDIRSVVLPTEEHTRLHFLQGVGFSDTLIEYLPSLFTTAIQFYSIFISSSSKDEVFANRLYQDLQAQGIRCWFAKHNLKPGNYIRKEIDQAIHLQDKFLLILSESAVNSGWVGHEVELALTGEMRQQREILFPIRLDNEVIQSTSHWATTLQATRQIGDFTNWMDPQTYQQAFDRLLRDLKKVNQ